MNSTTNASGTNDPDPASANASGTIANARKLTVEFNVKNVGDVSIEKVSFQGADNTKTTNENLKEFVKSLTSDSVPVAQPGGKKYKKRTNKRKMDKKRRTLRRK
jgi:hypothetical protein